MDSSRHLAPLLVGTGTLSNPRDMVRALETIEAFTYRYVVDGEEINAGRATLVRIMLDSSSATTLVNGCLFLNVSSFTYLNFTTGADGRTLFELFADGAVLEIVPTDEPESRGNQRQVIRLIDESVFEENSFVSLDDEDDED